MAAGSRLAINGREFTSDDILVVSGLPPEGTSKNAVGACMNALAKEFKLTRTGQTQSTRNARHAGMISRWKRLQA